LIEIGLFQRAGLMIKTDGVRKKMY